MSPKAIPAEERSRRLEVWAADVAAGLLDMTDDHYVFAYHTSEVAQLQGQVSLTMPVRLESWTSRDLHPVFQMNLPEGALLDSIRRAISKLTENDDLAILRVTGGNQVGRNRYSLPGEEAPGINESVESLEEMLSYPDTVELFHDLVAKYALRSGVSGVQPKVLLDAHDRGTAAIGGYIVKSWGEEYPHLAANEYFCMMAAKRAALTVPEFYMSENGGLFIMKRFDLTGEGVALGFEDMCSLQGVGTGQKYQSTYERMARTIKDFVSPEFIRPAREQFFATLVLSSMVRNGDAHLKNFGVLYDRPGSAVALAPIYDVVTTTAYLPKDVPALALAGTKKWWPRKMLEKFAVAHLGLAVGEIGDIIEKVADAVTDTAKSLSDYAQEHHEFLEFGERMRQQWRIGVDSLAAKN